jgi:hypothetical protein
MDTIAIVDISNQRCPLWTSPTAYAQARAQDTADRLRPMEATWASGRTVMAYPANYRPAIHALHESEIPPSPTLELRRLIDTQPRISRPPTLAATRSPPNTDSPRKRASGRCPSTAPPVTTMPAPSPTP